MNEEIIRALARNLKISAEQVQNTLSLLEQGATVPFIARYRKEMTRGLDEEQICLLINSTSTRSSWQNVKKLY